MKKLILLAGLLMCGLLIAAPVMAATSGTPGIVINDLDLTETITAINGGLSTSQFQTNSGTDAVPTITQETATTAGHVDFDGWYSTSSPLGIGVQVVYNFNIYDPASQGGAAQRYMVANIHR